MENKPHSPSNGAFSSELVLDGTPNAVKTFLFFSICIAWLIPGLFGHDPWKYEEAVSLGVIQEMVWHGHWLSPQITGEALRRAPPFFTGWVQLWSGYSVVGWCPMMQLELRVVYAWCSRSIPFQVPRKFYLAADMRA